MPQRLDKEKIVMTTQTFALTGLHCNACVGRVTKSLEPLASSVTVTLNPMQVVLTDVTADFETLQKAVAGAGKYVLIPNSAQNTAVDQSIRAKSAPEIVAIAESPASWLTTYSPLLLIVGYILGASVLVQVGMGSLASITTMDTMRYFMAGFFLVFSFFKLLDINAFADAYSGYDLLAMRWRGWGLMYPFVELALGIAYLANFNPLMTHWVTIIVMGFSAIGVIKAVASKTQIQCACLGTVFKLPMSTVTIVEDLGMVAMAISMLLFAA
jgi:copper chaperone CopZ